MQFADKMKTFEMNIFSAIDAKKRELEGKGKKLINLSIGTPDFTPDKHVMEAVRDAAMDPENYKYAVTDIPQLTDAVIYWYKNRYNVDIDKDEYISVFGSQEGVPFAALPICNPGDTVLIPNPGYPAYFFTPTLACANVGFTPLKEENNYLIDFDNFDTALADKAKMMIVSYPSNPLSATADWDFYERLVHFAKKHDILVIHDNAYSNIIFDAKPGMSMLEIPGAKDVCVEFNSLSKSYNLTGCRVSFALGNREVIKKLYTMRSQINYNPFKPVQYGAVAALTGPQDILKRNTEGYKARRDALCESMDEIGWHIPKSKATMFVWAPLPEGHTDSVKFTNDLMEKAGVVTIPGESFGDLGKDHVRFALTVPCDTLRLAAKQVKESGLIK